MTGWKEFAEACSVVCVFVVFGLCVFGLISLAPGSLIMMPFADWSAPLLALVVAAVVARSLAEREDN